MSGKDSIHTLRLEVLEVLLSLRLGDLDMCIILIDILAEERMVTEDQCHIRILGCLEGLLQSHLLVLLKF